MKLLVLIYSLLFFEELRVHVPVYIIEGLLTILKGYIKGGLPFDRLLNNDNFLMKLLQFFNAEFGL